MRYVVGNNVFLKASDVKEYIFNCVGEKYFKRMIDEKYGEIKIFDLCYKASDVFYKVNRQSYECKRKNQKNIQFEILLFGEFAIIFNYFNTVFTTFSSLTFVLCSEEKNYQNNNNYNNRNNKGF